MATPTSPQGGGGVKNAPGGLYRSPTAAKPPRMSNRWVVFKPDHKSFGEYIRSEMVRDMATEVAQDIARRAGELAPRRKSGQVPDGAAMADSFKVNREAGFIKVSGNIRVKVEVYNSAASAAPNEFGGARNKKHRMLARAGAEHGDFKSGKEGPLREDGTY